MAEEQNVAADGSSAPVKIGKRCFVGNLAWRTSWQDLKDKFRECGNVVYANVMRDHDSRSKGWGIVEFENPEEAAAAISALNGVELAGRRLLVREDREDRDLKDQFPEGGDEQQQQAPRQAPPRRQFSGGRGAGRGAYRGRGGRGAGGRGAPVEQNYQSSGLQVVVRGIPWSYTWKELKDYMSEAGDIDRADVVYGDDGRSRGFGTVRFYTAEAANKAIQEYNGTTLDGRSITVFMDKRA